MSIIYGYIYKTTNLINGKVYIGQHKGKYNPNYLGSGKLIVFSIKKYGGRNFNIQFIRYCVNRNQLDRCEEQLIKKSILELGKENVYNIAPGGWGGDLLTNHPRKEEIIQKMIKSRTGHITTEETKRKIRNSSLGRHLKGVPRPEDVKLRISKKLKGVLKKPFSEEHRRNIGKAQRGIPKGPITEEHRNNLRKARKEYPHKPDCICGCCRAIRGENLFKQKDSLRKE